MSIKQLKHSIIFALLSPMYFVYFVYIDPTINFVYSIVLCMGWAMVHIIKNYCTINHNKMSYRKRCTRWPTSTTKKHFLRTTITSNKNSGISGWMVTYNALSFIWNNILFLPSEVLTEALPCFLHLYYVKV